MVTHLRMFHGRKVTRQESSGMVSHLQMFHAIVDEGCRTTPPRTTVWNVLHAHAYARGHVW
jgi:hypothetical protein